jgi:hypothetical protein
MKKSAPGSLTVLALASTVALLLPAVAVDARTVAQEVNALRRQELPDMNQAITPLAVHASRFQPMNPNLADIPDWLAQDAAHCVVSPDQKTLADSAKHAIYRETVRTAHRSLNPIPNANWPVYRSGIKQPGRPL